ncbi:hypothetical protein HMPREF2738_02273 [Clostridiales bacterium KLE1615]|nr:hypothetical protein HMPREF2738_02273 [Clostridiales bacterium KLE1615]
MSKTELRSSDTQNVWFCELASCEQLLYQQKKRLSQIAAAVLCLL